MSIKNTYNSIKEVGKFVIKHPKASLELLAMGIGTVIGTGCAGQIPINSVDTYKHPKIQVVESGMDIKNEKKLEDMISQSISLKEKGFMRYNIKDEIKEEVEEEIGEKLVVKNSIFDLADNFYLSKENNSLNISVDKIVYSQNELKEILDENKIFYIEAKIDSTKDFSFNYGETMYAIMTEEGQDLFQKKIKEKYPNRLNEVTEELNKEFDELQTKEKKELIKKIKENNHVFINLEGIVSPFVGDYEWLSNEQRLNTEKLSEFFNNKDYNEFHISRKEEQFKTLLNLIKENSDENYEVVIFYNGHGVEKGISLGFSNILEAEEIETYLEGFKGKTYLFVNSCFSGDVKNYFEKRKANITVVSASKQGKTLKASDFDKPGYLVQDVIKADMNLENFKKDFKRVRRGDYYPKMYSSLKN